MLIMGTRPEIVKMASVVSACRELGVEHEIVQATQHYDWEMSGQFMEELNIGRATRHVHVGSGTQAVQTSRAMVNIAKLIRTDKPAVVVIQGDTNTVLGAALGAKLQAPVCHVEAGIRSYDLRMPEEHNRILVDHASTLLFAPTKHAAQTLRREGVWGQIRTVGNTVIDACLKFKEEAMRESKILQQTRFDKFALATFHRAENVDDHKTLLTITKVLTHSPIPVIFPVHPRTMGRLRSFGIITKLKKANMVQILPAVGYYDLLTLLSECEFVITDSGGLQEETTAPNIRKFTFVMRRTTDRPESVEAGFAKLVGTENSVEILRSIKTMINHPIELPTRSPYGDGKAGLRIARALKVEFSARSNPFEVS